VDSESVGFGKVKKLDQPELRISVKALEEFTDRELAHRLALAVVVHKTVYSSAMKNTAIAVVVPLCLVLYAAYWWLTQNGWTNGVAILALFAAYLVVGAVVLFPFTIHLGTRVHLEVIELTGDSQTAVDFFLKEAEYPVWAPNFLRKWESLMRRKQLRSVEKELRNQTASL